MIFGDHDTQQPALIKVDAWHNPRSGLLKGVVIFGGYDVAYVAGVLHLLGMALRDYSISCGPSRCHRACRLQGGRGGGLRNRNPRLLSFGTVHFFFLLNQTSNRVGVVPICAWVKVSTVFVVAFRGVNVFIVAAESHTGDFFL